MPKPNIKAKSPEGKPVYKRRLPFQKLMKERKEEQRERRIHKLSAKTHHLLKRDETKEHIAAKQLVGESLYGSNAFPNEHKADFQRYQTARRKTRAVQLNQNEQANKYGNNTIHLKSTFAKRKVPKHKPKPPPSKQYNPLKGHQGLQI